MNYEYILSCPRARRAAGVHSKRIQNESEIGQRSHRFDFEYISSCPRARRAAGFTRNVFKMGIRSNRFIKNKLCIHLELPVCPQSHGVHSRCIQNESEIGLFVLLSFVCFGVVLCCVVCVFVFCCFCRSPPTRLTSSVFHFPSIPDPLIYKNAIGV